MPDARLTFCGSTLGYGGHPAVHLLSGSVRKGAPGPEGPAPACIDLIRTNAGTIPAAIAAE